MDEFTPFHDAGFLEFFLYEIFHGLHVVVCHLFYLLHFRGFFRSEFPVYVPKSLEFRMVEVCQLRKRDFAEGYEIFYFDADTVADQCKFAEILPEGLCLTLVPSVDRRYCHK